MVSTAVREGKTLQGLRLLAKIALEACGFGHATCAQTLAVVVPATAPMLQRCRLVALATEKDVKIRVECARAAKCGGILEVLQRPAL